MSEIKQLKGLIDKATRIVFFGGAGVSTESGIPDFRSEKGLYKAKQEYGRSPEEMISHSFFVREPEIFYDYYKKNLIYPDAQPNAAHLGIAALEGAGKDVRVVTQNIDGLHTAAGSTHVYELHGSVLRNYCLKCGAKYDLAYIMDPAHCVPPGGGEAGHVPYCEKCGGMVRPDVVLYEEGLDDATVKGAVDAIAKADLLIVGGTSLVVYPAAGFLNYYHGKDLVLINLTATSADRMATLAIREPIGEVFAALG
ncbi:MAG: NAD-dependent protein deacylase [Clostridiales Family XIII bacterium]|jgi:NAD-dependent deacetylase|nr:NAD-dependent protein deacylase [Clostridiales Family XIII bacterium]